jgi:glycosyltransferase involved in cell wall biosynthesis
MRIAINASLASDRCTGIGVYGRSLISALIAVAPTDTYAFDLYTGPGLSYRALALKGQDRFIGQDRPTLSQDRSTMGQGCLSQGEFTSSTSGTVWHHEVPGGVKRLVWENWSAASAARRRRADILHSTTPYLPFHLPCPAVLTVHDLALYHRFPAPAQPGSMRPGHTQVRPWANRTIGRALFEGSVRRAARLIAVSETTGRDLQTFLKVPPEKVRVVFEGVQSRFRPCPDLTALAACQARYGITAPYVVSVATAEPRKNLLRLLRAFRQLKDQHPDLPHVLVRVGKSGWMDSAVQVETAALQARGYLVQTGFVPNDDLPLLYAGAAAAAYPSLFEGFGLPVLEAMASGAPVVTSTAPAIREVASDVALLVDPEREDAIAAALHQVLTNPQLAARLRADGLRRAARFTWEEAARHTLAVYDEVVNGNLPNPRRPAVTARHGLEPAHAAMDSQNGVPERSQSDNEHGAAPRHLSVLIITPVFDSGGTESQVLEIGRGLMEQGDRYVVITGGGVQLAQLSEWNIPYRLVRATAGTVSPLRELAAYGWAVFTELCRQPADVIQSTSIRTTYAAYLGRLAYQTWRRATFWRLRWREPGWRADVPIVTTVHGGMRTDIYQQAAKHLSRLADHVIAPVRYGGSEMVRLGLPPERLTTIPSARNLDEFFTLDRRRPAAIPGVPDDARVIGTLARLAPTKGLDDLIRAFARLHPQFPDLHLVIAGTGELEAELRALAEELDITSRVAFAGYRTDVPELLRRFEILALSPVWEGLSLVIREAMAGGLPIVATAVGGICELLSDGETGLLVAPHDPEALAAALRRLLDDPELARQLGQQAQTHVRTTQTVAAMIAATRALYLKLAGYEEEGINEEMREVLWGWTSIPVNSARSHPRR